PFVKEPERLAISWRQPLTHSLGDFRLDGFGDIRMLGRQTAVHRIFGIRAVSSEPERMPHLVSNHLADDVERRRRPVHEPTRHHDLLYDDAPFEDLRAKGAMGDGEVPGLLGPGDRNVCLRRRVDEAEAREPRARGIHPTQHTLSRGLRHRIRLVEEAFRWLWQ